MEVELVHELPLATWMGLIQQVDVRLIDPFGVQMQLHLVAVLLNQADDLCERLFSKACGKEWLDKEHTLQAMIAQ